MYRPRLSQFLPVPMLGSRWWYSTGNQYYPAYGLPNCTCYADGRVSEINGKFIPIPAGNGRDWWTIFQQPQYPYSMGPTPELGCVMCWGPKEPEEPEDWDEEEQGPWEPDPDDPYYTALGHVGVCEEIAYDINDNPVMCRTSNSGYPSSYFFTDDLYRADDWCARWMRSPSRNYELQGCVYTGDNPVDIYGHVHRSPIWMMLRYRR